MVRNSVGLQGVTPEITRSLVTLIATHTYCLFNKRVNSILVATERSQLSPIERCMNTLASECDSAGFFQWPQL